MRIAFLVNAIESEHPRYATTVMAQEALSRGHDICYAAPGDFVLRDDDSLSLRATVLPKSGYQKPETLQRDLVGGGAIAETLDITDIDVLFLRNDPSDDAGTRDWATRVGPMFGRLAAERGVLVVNDPDGLALAQDKLYFQGFPESVRPTTLISRSVEEIRNFIAEQEQGAIVKPMQGSGGENIFKIDSTDDKNLNQIVEAISDDGYLIAQAYIPAASAGDVRVFLVNGVPLQREGKYAALRRVPADGEIRSNMHADGSAVKVEMSDRILELATAVRPKLVRDGMFLVGLDIVGEHILEINVFTPGGLWSLGEMYGTDFAASVIDALEEKVVIRAAYSTAAVSNRTLATL